MNNKLVAVPALPQFYGEVRSLAAHTGWRIGQALFNHLAQVRQDLADRVLNTNIDPSKATTWDDPRMLGCVDFISKHWNI